MQALVFYGPTDVRVEEFAAPVVGASDVLLDIEACGVCGSDLASYAHGHYVAPGQVMGHEMSARLAAVGAGLSGLTVGQRVAVRPMRSCGHCSYCRGGETHLCGSTAGPSLGYGAPGAYAEQLLITAVEVGRDVVAVPDDVDPFDLLWAEPLAVALHAFRQAASPRRLLVTGAGAVGLAVTAAAIAHGSEVGVVEPVAERRDAATLLGARSWAPGESPDGDRFDALIDASGVPQASMAVLDWLQVTAPVVLVGLGDAAVPWPVDPHRIVGSFAYRESDFADAVALIASGRVSLAPFVTHRFGLEDADRALAAPRPEDHVVKAAIVPGHVDHSTAGPARSPTSAPRP